MGEEKLVVCNFSGCRWKCEGGGRCVVKTVVKYQKRSNLTQTESKGLRKD